MTHKPRPEVRYFPGELEAIETVERLGAIYGYGNLIARLSDAWSEHMQTKYKFPKGAADLAGRHICVWCYTDSRTGKVRHDLKPKPKRKQLKVTR